MEMDLTNITFIAVAATIVGVFMVRFRQPAAVGYIIAGALLGSLGILGSETRESIFYLAQLGVILLLYFIGMELSVRNLHDIWRVSLFTLLGQIVFSLGMSFFLGYFFGWSPETAILFAFCLALSSTAIASKTLESYDETKSHVGKLTIGILIAQDLAVAPMLLIISGLQSGGSGLMAVGTIALEVGLAIAILVVLVFALTRRKTINLPFHRVWLEKQELTSLWALAFCFLLATICGFLGLTPAFGAFLAGLIVGNSAQYHEVRRDSVPIQSILLMVFFLSIGLLLDFDYILNNLGTLLILSVIVLVFKNVLNSLLLRLQGETWADSFRSSLILGQMGEFSFILGSTALAVYAIDNEFHKLIVALTVISLLTTPLFNNVARRLSHRAAAHLTRPSHLLRFVWTPELRKIKKYLKFEKKACNKQKSSIKE